MKTNSQKFKKVIFTLCLLSLALFAIIFAGAKADIYYGYSTVPTNPPGLPQYPSSNPAPMTGNPATGGTSYSYYSPRLTLDTLRAAMNCSGTTVAQHSTAMGIFSQITDKKQRNFYIYGNDGAFANGGPFATPQWQWTSGMYGQTIQYTNNLQTVHHNDLMYDYTVDPNNPPPVTDPGGPFLVKNIIEALAGVPLSTIWYGGGASPDYYIAPVGTTTSFQYVPGPTSPDAPSSANVTTACGIVDGALAGDVNALGTLQHAFVSNNFFASSGYKPCDVYMDVADAIQVGQSTLNECPGMPTISNDPGIVGRCYPTGENVGVEALAFMVGGDALNALRTIQMALPIDTSGTQCTGPNTPSGCNSNYGAPQGDPDAIAVLNQIFTYPPVNNVPDINHGCRTIEAGCDANAPSKLPVFLSTLWGGMLAADNLSQPPSPVDYLDCAINPNGPNCNPNRTAVMAQMFVSQIIQQYLTVNPIQPNSSQAGYHPVHDEPADAYQFCPRVQMYDSVTQDYELSAYTYIGQPAIIYLQQSYSTFPPVTPPAQPPLVTPPPSNTGGSPGTTGSWTGALNSLGGLFSQSGNTGSQINEDDSGYENPCDSDGKEEVDIGDESHSWPFDPGSAGTGVVHDDATTPCRFTRATRNLDFAMNYLGGEQWDIYFKNWIDEQWMGGSNDEPVLKKMAKQLTAAIINQTRQIGSAIDAKTLSDFAMNLQKDETKAKKKSSPSQLTCTSASMLGTFSTNPPTVTPPPVNDGSNWVAGNASPNQPVQTQATPGQATSAYSQSVTASAMALSLEKDLQRQAQGATGAGATGGRLADQQEKWQKYCSLFSDPTSNNGHSGCQTAGLYKNADIDVESFLFKDTVDMTNPMDKEVIPVLLRNLTQAEIDQKLPDSIVTAPDSRQSILKGKHLRAARNIANNVIASIIARRQAGPELPPPPPPPPPPNLQNMPVDPDNPGAGAFDGSVTQGGYDSFLAQLGGRESGTIQGNYTVHNQFNYIGRWQFGEPALIGVKCLARDDKPYSHSYKNNATHNGGLSYSGGYIGICKDVTNITDGSQTSKDAQDAAIRALMAANWRTIHRLGLDQYICNVVRGVLVTPSGLLGGSHLVGVGGVQTFLTGKGGHKWIDGNGVGVPQYMTKSGQWQFAGYETPFSTVSNCGTSTAAAGTDPQTGQAYTTGGTGVGYTAVVNPPDPVDLKTAVQEIRKKAGVEATRISDKPSYNEVMLAMTRERFFDPEYFIKTADNIGAVKQEQASIQSYISIQMQDIYKIQEQINMLLAARAGLKYNQQPRPNGISQAPLE